MAVIVLVRAGESTLRGSVRVATMPHIGAV
jgi:hypothetical protein